MIGFVLGHMLGNLQVFDGPARLNGYSAFLHGTGELLWLVRAVLLAAVILHIDAAVSLTRIAHAARPIGYAERRPQVSTLASRTMRWGGVLLAAFIVFHILHMTTGTLHPAFAAGRRLRQRSERVPRLAGRRVLPRGHGRARAASLPRNVELGAYAGCHAPHRQSAPPSPGPRRRRRRGGRLRPRPSRRAGRLGAVAGHGCTRGAGSVGPARDEVGAAIASSMKLVNPANKRKYTIIVVGTGPGRRLRGGHAERARATASSASPTTTRHGARTASRRRAASTPPRTIRTTVTPSFGCSTTRSRAETSARARPTSTGWPKSASTSSTSASRRACPSRGSTAAYSPTGRSAARRYRERSTRAARPASSCCWAPTRRSSGRSGVAPCDMHPHTEMLDLVVVDGRARGIVARDLVTGADAVVRRRRGRAGHRRLRQRLLSVDQRAELQRHRHLAGAQARRRVRAIRASRRFTRRASRSAATTSPS